MATSYPGSQVPIRRAGEMPLPPAYQGSLYSDIGKGIRQTTEEVEGGLQQYDAAKEAEAERKRVLEDMIHKRKVAQELRESKAQLDQANLSLAQEAGQRQQAEESRRSESYQIGKEDMDRSREAVGGIRQQIIDMRNKLGRMPTEGEFRDIVATSEVFETSKGPEMLKQLEQRLGYAPKSSDSWREEIARMNAISSRMRAEDQTSRTGIMQSKESRAVADRDIAIQQGKNRFAVVEDTAKQLAEIFNRNRNTKSFGLYTNKIPEAMTSADAQLYDKVLKGLEGEILAIVKVPGSGPQTDNDAEAIYGNLPKRWLREEVSAALIANLDRKIQTLKGTAYREWEAYMQGLTDERGMPVGQGTGASGEWGPASGGDPLNIRKAAPTQSQNSSNPLGL